MKTVPSTGIDRIFRAVSDRTRLRILALLGDGEVCVCDIVAALGIPQPKASRHLAYLRRSGLVLGRRDGQWRYYRLAPARGEFHAKLLDCLKHCLCDVPEVGRDSKRLRQARHGRCCDSNCE
jgi:ArsR family transcriptional regulator